jgi:ABC-type sugar transport system ATPase subunit
LEEVFEIGDRVIVLRDGENSGGGMVKDLNQNAIISMMVGRTLGNRFPKSKVEIGEEILRVEKINNDRVNNASFSLRKGEILGFSGLVGAGRSDLMNAIMGIDKCTGEIYLDGEKIQNDSPSQAIARGFAAVPEDRKEKGLILILPVMHNMQLSAFQRFTNKLGFLNRIREENVAQEYVNKLSIKVESFRQKAGNLSGGNQQKVVLARGLISNPKVLILDEPTRGIDVGSKAEIYEIMNNLVEQGVSIIMVSSELPELLNMSDRIIVMHEGFIVGQLDPAEATEEKIITLATQEISEEMSVKEAVE